jgi:hypothetical protein
MYEIIQTIKKSIKSDAEFEVYYNNFRKYGWKESDIQDLIQHGKMSREGKLGDGELLSESVEIKSKFEIIKGGLA